MITSSILFLLWLIGLGIVCGATAAGVALWATSRRVIVSYQCFSTTDGFQQFENMVEGAIKEGWVPQGGFSTTYVSGELLWCQAMVKWGKK